MQGVRILLACSPADGCCCIQGAVMATAAFASRFLDLLVGLDLFSMSMRQLVCWHS